MEALLKQYDKTWDEIDHLDKSNLEITLLYIVLIGAYMGVLDRILGRPIIAAIVIAIFGMCVVGILHRLRCQIAMHKATIAVIEKRTLMIAPRHRARGLAGLKMSVYLEGIVISLNILAIYLTLFR